MIYDAFVNTVSAKYGLIYHASLIGQATGKNKGKIARMLAAKSALGLRVDALSTWGVSSEDTSKEPSEEEKSQLGRDARLTIERRLRALEGKPLKSLANANQTALGGQKKWEVKEARKYNPDADGLTGDEPAADAPKESKKAKAPKKLVQEVDSDEDESMADADAGADESDSDSEEEKDTAKLDPKKAAKQAAKEAKKARKEARAAKRDAKKAKKAAKEAKKSDTKESKKRKADGGDDGEKKKKKKKSKD